MPSRKGLTSTRIVNFPIMDDWQRHVQIVVRGLSEAHQSVVFERYFGQEFDRFGYKEWAKHLNISKHAYASRLNRAHKLIKSQLDNTLQGAIQSAKIP